MSLLWGVGHIWRGGSNLALRRGNFGVPYTIYNKDMEAEVFMIGGVTLGRGGAVSWQVYRVAFRASDRLLFRVRNSMASPLPHQWWWTSTRWTHHPADVDLHFQETQRAHDFNSGVIAKYKRRIIMHMDIGKKSSKTSRNPWRKDAQLRSKMNAQFAEKTPFW